MGKARIVNELGGGQYEIRRIYNDTLYRQRKKYLEDRLIELNQEIDRIHTDLLEMDGRLLILKQDAMDAVAHYYSLLQLYHGNAGLLLVDDEGNPITDEDGGALLDLPAPGEIDDAALAAARADMLRLQTEVIERTGERRQRHNTLLLLKLKQSQCVADRNALNNVKAYDFSGVMVGEVETAWCADCTEGLSGDIATIEIPGEPQRLLIHPQGRGEGAYTPARDGLLMPRAWQISYQAYYNAAILPGWQRHRPTYRLATITATDTITATLELSAAHNSSSRYYNANRNTNPSTPVTFSDVPIHYMSCNGAVFAVGDRVVVEFPDRTWDAPRIIGFASEPKCCGGGVYILLTGITYYNVCSGHPLQRLYRLEADDSLTQVALLDPVECNKDFSFLQAYPGILTSQVDTEQVDMYVRGSHVYLLTTHYRHGFIPAEPRTYAVEGDRYVAQIEYKLTEIGRSTTLQHTVQSTWIRGQEAQTLSTVATQFDHPFISVALCATGLFLLCVEHGSWLDPAPAGTLFIRHLDFDGTLIKQVDTGIPYIKAIPNPNENWRTWNPSHFFYHQITIRIETTNAWIEASEDGQHIMVATRGGRRASYDGNLGLQWNNPNPHSARGSLSNHGGIFSYIESARWTSQIPRSDWTKNFAPHDMGNAWISPSNTLQISHAGAPTPHGTYTPIPISNELSRQNHTVDQVLLKTFTFMLFSALLEATRLIEITTTWEKTGLPIDLMHAARLNFRTQSGDLQKSILLNDIIGDVTHSKNPHTVFSASTIRRAIVIDPDPNTDRPDIDLAIINAHNRIRAEHDRAPLTLDLSLRGAARFHNLWQREVNLISHTGEGGSGIVDRVRHQLFGGPAVGENLAVIHPRPTVEEIAEAAMTGWMNSPGHRANLLNPAWSFIGVHSIQTHHFNGEAKGAYDPNTGGTTDKPINIQNAYLFTVVFGADTPGLKWCSA